MEHKKYLEIAIEAARRAGKYLSGRNDLAIDSSVGKDIKLSSDRNSEKIIIDELSASGLPILTEESGYIGDISTCYWVVDPLDGSMNYFKGLDDFSCVSIALWENNEPTIGVIYRYARDEMFTALKGENAMLNGKKIETSGIKNIDAAVMATGFPVKRDYSNEGLLSFFNDVRRFKKVRMLGSAALMAVFVACGRIDAYFEEDIMLWDVAAAIAIVKAAGGGVSYKLKSEGKCIISCFSTLELMEEYHAKSI